MDMKKISRSQYRLPIDLAEWLDARAKNNSRSRNGELVAILRSIKDGSPGTLQAE